MWPTQHQLSTELIIYLDEHLLCFSGLCTPAYATLPEGSYRAIEARVSRAAEFVGVVIVPFIMDDAKQFLVSLMHSGLTK
jgi:hypothetical protein